MKNQIAKLSDKMLLNKLIVLSKRETEVTADILLHLIELDKRKLYRNQGYQSLYAYCVSRLGYSPSAAKRRLVAARCIRDYPEVYRMFMKKDISLTTIAIFAPALTKQNHQVILSQVSQKSPAEVEWIVGRYNPSRPGFDRIVPIVVSKVAEINGHRTEDVHQEAKNLELNLGSREPTLNCQENQGCQSAVEERYRFEFSASKSFKDKLDTVKALASGAFGPGARLEKILELVMDEYIDRHSPEKREERRKAREEKRAGKLQLVPTLRNAVVTRTGQSISQRTRDKVLLRDGFKCTYVSDDGVQCRATTNLHLDHITPRGRGGTNSPENLRVLCGAHNRLVAEQEYGKWFMERFYYGGFQSYWTLLQVFNRVCGRDQRS